MSRELVTAWLQKIASAERDLPLLILGDIAYTPRTAYDEVMRGSELGNRLQALIETGRFGTTPLEEQQIAKIRLRQIMQAKPNVPMFATLSNKVFTPSELMAEIESDTDIGNQWVSNEKLHMQRIVQIR